MTSEKSDDGAPATATEEDRVVSRRVDNPTAATAADERAYPAAGPDTDPLGTDTENGDGGTAESAREDLGSDDESEPVRSE